MAKKDADLFDRLRKIGLRKQAAKALSGVSDNAGKKAQGVARAAVTELRTVADEIERRLPAATPAPASRARKTAATPAPASSARKTAATPASDSSEKKTAAAPRARTTTRRTTRASTAGTQRAATAKPRRAPRS